MPTASNVLGRVLVLASIPRNPAAGSGHAQCVHVSDERPALLTVALTTGTSGHTRIGWPELHTHDQTTPQHGTPHAGLLPPRTELFWPSTAKS